MHAGDLVFASVILLSGNNFQKTTTLAKFMKLSFLSSSTFHRIQKTYLVPSIDRFWIQKQDDTLREFENTDVIVLEKEFPEIKHSFDVWHGTKNLDIKLTKISQEKENKELLVWVNYIVNHYWHTAEVATSSEEFLWFVPFANSTFTNGCQNGPLEDGTHSKESTSELENFQNLILMYASKRHSYSPPVYRARNRLAAIDHNAHAEREVMKNRDGSLRWQRSYNKTTSCEGGKQL
ncbi:unnamed protein product [Mytilus coruscus]|uniref:Uncharacterized protein n=1 Tax=Mytilus coruscus TaxID=42192 RepID=A0A6J8EG88_MYTCO|nr:unnamed protein product [Mytilus coruscus]